MNRSRRCRARVGRGFTLVELLVGLGAAATSAALLAAGAGGVRGQAEVAACAGNLKTIGQAAAQYTTDHKGWLVGAPGTSGRELLNDSRARTAGSLALDVNGDATQVFDWAGPLAWTYIAPQSVRPDRRDERFALLNGTNIPDYTNPNYDPLHPDLTPSSGALGVFADAAQSEISDPFFETGILPNGIPGSAFQPRLATSYISGTNLLWWSSSNETPRWATASFWGATTAGSFRQNSSSAADTRLPGDSSSMGLQLPYRPSIERIGDPARKVFLADGTRFQSASQAGIDHDVSAHAILGGAFADTGAWDTSFSRGWPLGSSLSGRDMSGTSFRHGAGGSDSMGNVLYYDGAVQLLSISAARRPELWMPRGTLLHISTIWADIRGEYSVDLTTNLGLPFTRIN